MAKEAGEPGRGETQKVRDGEGEVRELGGSAAERAGRQLEGQETG